MWPPSYQERLQSWADLRQQCRTLSLQKNLQLINDWWMRAPTVNRYLHWDDVRDWPTPWELLADDIYCDLARALGIVYTIILTEHEKVHEVSLIQTKSDNLVQVNHGKYILNWAPGQMLNINSENTNIIKQISSDKLLHRVR